MVVGSSATPSLSRRASINYPGDIARDVERLGYSPALRNQAGQFIRGCEKQAFRQFLNFYPNASSISPVGSASVLRFGFLTPDSEPA